MALTAAERENAHRQAQLAAQRVEQLIALHQRSWPQPSPANAPPRPSPDAPKRPREPKRPPVEPFATKLLADIPRWRFGERRVARRVATQQADAAHKLALEAHESALAVHEQRVAQHERQLARLEEE